MFPPVKLQAQLLLRSKYQVFFPTLFGLGLRITSSPASRCPRFLVCVMCYSYSVESDI